MLPSKKCASPGRSDRELMPCSRVGGESIAAAPDAAVHMSRSRALCAFAAAAAASCSALSASAMSRCIWRGAPYAGASSPCPPLALTLFTPRGLARARSRRGRPDPGRSPGAGVLPSSERSAGGAPPSLARAGADELGIPVKVAPLPSPPIVATLSPSGSSVSPGKADRQGPWKIAQVRTWENLEIHRFQTSPRQDPSVPSRAE